MVSCNQVGAKTTGTLFTSGAKTTPSRRQWWRPWFVRLCSWRLVQNLDRCRRSTIQEHAWGRPFRAVAAPRRPNSVVRAFSLDMRQPDQGGAVVGRHVSKNLWLCSCRLTALVYAILLPPWSCRLLRTNFCRLARTASAPDVVGGAHAGCGVEPPVPEAHVLGGTPAPDVESSGVCTTLSSGGGAWPSADIGVGTHSSGVQAAAHWAPRLPAAVVSLGARKLVTWGLYLRF